MKRKLTEHDALAAVWGGAILGGGGGGLIELGLRAARLALEVGTPELWSVDEFADDAMTCTCAYVGAPGAPELFVPPAHFVRAIELLRKELPPAMDIVALNTNENGSETTVNGWIQAALTGLPVLDLACNGRAHPSSLMGSLGLHREAAFVSQQAYAGGKAQRYIEGTLRGQLEQTSLVIRKASVIAGGGVAVARNPVSIGYASEHGAPGGISHAIELGQAFLSGGIDAAAAFLNGRVVAEGVVKAYRCEQVGGLDVGTVVLDDAAATEVPFLNEYMLLEQRGERIAAFPDLITTFDADSGKPVPSADVRPGQRVRVLHAPAASLLLSRTMYMPELYEHLEARLSKRFAPVTTV